MARHAVRIGPGGRMVIPAELREKLDVKPGDTSWLGEEQGEVRITSVRQAIRYAQEFVAQQVVPERSLVDELIADRRDEATRQ